MTSFREIDLRKIFDSEEIRELRRKHAAESNRKLKKETREMLMNTKLETPPSMSIRNVNFRKEYLT